MVRELLPHGIFAKAQSLPNLIQRYIKFSALELKLDYG